ncbi:MAG: Transcriptional regulator, LytR family [Parcubacteria group bacterium GW2011_GWC1_39_29]|nr:MAG: Transcriptional regulator, LytR family [Parcubacteria group bacterium GW2011_GWC1_39_29]
MYREINFLDPSGDTKKDKKSLLKLFFLVVFVIALGVGGLKLGLAYNEFTITSDNNQPFWNKITGILSLASEKTDPTPTPDPNRLNILVMGMRGMDDPDSAQGGMLTDTILVFSFDKTTKKSSIVSIPRDLYVKFNKSKTDKINAVYEYGYARKEGIEFSKRVYSIVTGIHIDKAIVFDFSSFKKIIDELDGIDIVLDRPFTEKSQWGSEFNLPAGPNHLDGETALYYARSRYSTSDFDRSRRQQQIIEAIKIKALDINIATDPIKALSLINLIRKDVTTDINLFNLQEMIQLFQELKNSQPKHYIISTDNLVYQTYIDSIYVLLPKNESFKEIQDMFQNILK